MSKSTFDNLLEKIIHRITKKDTLMRDAIPPHHRLALTLRFLASGNNFQDLKFLTAIAPQTISEIVIETCEAIISELKDYIKLPQTPNEWKKEASDFYHLWNFPNCIGAIDGKHVNIRQPPGSGSFYFNYKKSFSIILMAVVNANYEFLMVDVGTNGRASDGEPLPGCDEKMPFVFVADDAFPLSENILKPFSHNTLKKEEIIFNYRLSRARRLVENAFGILASRFRILLQTINLSPEKTTSIVLACCYLHNFLRREYEQTYFEGGFDSEIVETGAMEYADWHNGPNLQNLKASTSKNATNNAKYIRETFSTYFNTNGAVSWQNKIFK
ncbi:putative nuclease HARBI1 isoform X2 [Lucilia sericata]|uniref:putative nuclease HARBI1 isoform X2 n=1 Tax=Lucilia sericata TaxID=13632 RepID=UPI0018A83233|nr:putative nuclease HARBI1 isoform X2 [Lucilia sericata]